MTYMEEQIRAMARVLTAETDQERDAAKVALLKVMNIGPVNKRPPKQKVNTETMVRRLLTDLGCPEHLMGHACLVHAIVATVDDPSMLRHITKRLYVDTAKACETTPTRAERAIRHCIEVSYERCDVDLFTQYFGNTVSPSKGKPTNSEYIARVANIVRERMREEI